MPTESGKIPGLFIAGIDEAGRGPLAGPVTAASVILPVKFNTEGIADSKKLTSDEREKAYKRVVRSAMAYSVVSVGARRIDRINIREATKLAMILSARRVHAKVCARYGADSRIYYLIDGNMPFDGNEFPNEAIIKGDDLIAVISAASILAKVTRDRLMCELERKYPGYGFSKHKGYATQFHLEQVAALGPCKIHRRAFAGVKEHLDAVQARQIAFDYVEIAAEEDLG